MTIERKMNARKYSKCGANAVNKQYKERKLIKDVFKELEQLQAVSEKDEDIKKELEKMGVDRDIINNEVVACYAMLLQAKSGNTKAFELYRDTIGEKPSEQIQANVNSNNAISELTTDELRKIINEDKK